MLKSYPRFLVNEGNGQIQVWKLWSYGANGRATYERVRPEPERRVIVDILGRYPKQWEENLERIRFRKMTATEELLYGKEE